MYHLSSTRPSSSDSISTFQHMFRYLWITVLQTSLVPLYLNNSLSISICPDLGEMADIIDDVSVEMIPLRYH